jgi:trehalose 6-phosphate synthase
MLRSRLPNASITTFWHIPWPSAGEFETCPWSRYLLDGLLGSTILGFQTATDCENFIDTARRLLDVTIDPLRNTISYAGRETFVRSYAASVDWPSPWLAEAEPVPVCAREIRQQLGVKRTTRLIVGIDRMDYTKGIEEKLLSVERLLDEYPALLETFVFLQVAQPSRQRLPAYQDLRVRVNAIADRVNERFATERWQPVVLVETHQEPREVYRLLRAADVCYVGSLHDGMNLVAKEFVSSREDEYGVLLLSSFAGAARELTDALVVNPYDVDQSANALALALAMPAEEQGHRMRRMRETVQAWNARHWALEILTDASRLGIEPQSEPGQHLVTH